MRHTALLALCLLTAVPASADDWPMYLGDLAHTSFRPGETQITAQNVGQLQQLWKTSVGSPAVSGVTVNNGFLYFGDWSGNFHSLNATTGASVWTQFLGRAPAPADPTCQPRGIGVSAQAVVSGEIVYAAGGDSTVYAMDRSTGNILWRVTIADSANGGYLWSSLMLSQNALYIGIASLTDCPLVRGGLARIPLDNPTHVQTAYFTPAGTLGAGVWSTPAIDEANNLVYVTTGNADRQDAAHGVYGSALLALDATTLAVRSSFFLPFPPEDNDADWGSSPMLFDVAGDPMIAANGKTGVMYVLHRPDLTLAWTYKLARDCDSPTLGCGSISTPSFDGSALFTGAGQPDGDDGPPGTVYKFDPATQSLLWLYPTESAVLAPVTLTPGLVFVGSNKRLAALDASSGSELWSDSGASGGIYGQPVVSNGIVYSAHVTGSVVAWSLGATTGGGAGLAVSQNSLQYLYSTGGLSPDPQSIIVSTSSASANFTVASDSPWLTTNVVSGSTPSMLTVLADPSGMAPGVYAGTLTVATPGSSPLLIKVSLVVHPAPPALAASSVVNAATFQTGMAPGSLFSIFSGGLSADTMTASADPWPANWEGISVKINGVAAPLAYVSPAQINAQVPFEVAAGPAQMTIESNGVVSAPVTVMIQSAAPGIFMNSSGRAAALNQDLSTNRSDNPALPGTVISLYLTGQGGLDRAIASGSAAPTDGLANTVLPTTATIKGVPATVVFSGLAPGFVGLAQVNVNVPALPPGDQPVVVTIGGVPSNPATITLGQ